MAMILYPEADKQHFAHVSSITHEGKNILVATDADGKIWYSVKQDGFEDSYLHDDPKHRTGWEKWQQLPLPGAQDEQDSDASVTEQEKKDLAVPGWGNKLIMQSCYTSQDLSEVAPVQLVSGLGHLYVFRQSTTKTLLVDRFVLDGMTNKLVRKLEVRFKRSRQKHTPLQRKDSSNPNKLATIDSLDFRDADNKPFHEPTIELSLIDGLENGWFSVVLVPTNDHDIHRWHFFSWNLSSNSVQIVSIRSSMEGLFEVKDQLVVQPRPETQAGILRRSLELHDHDGNRLVVTQGLVATSFDIQTEKETNDGPQLLRGATRIMLAVPTDKGTAAISFAVAANGTLSQIDQTPGGGDEPLRADKREMMLPLDTLDRVVPIGDSTPPPHGAIKFLVRDEGDDQVVVTPGDGDDLEKVGIGDFVKIEGTVSYDGFYGAVQDSNDEAFIVNRNTGTLESMGTWTKLEKEETGLVFDGMVTGYGTGEEGLVVVSPGHGLVQGDKVQIAETRDCNGLFRIASISESEFTLERKWQPGKSINLKREAGKRRGIQLNDAAALIETPPIELDDPGDGKAVGMTCSVWIQVPENGAMDRSLLARKDNGVRLVLKEGHVVLELFLDEGIKSLKDPTPVTRGEWIHFSAVVSTSKTQAGVLGTDLSLCRNGQIVATAGQLPGGVKSEAALIQKLVSVEKDPEGSAFGCSVAIDGSTALVGAQWQSNEGAAYVYECRNGVWTMVQALYPNERDDVTVFGNAVAISGDTAVVAAWSGEAGAVYVFTRKNGKWIETEILYADQSDAGDCFGKSIAIKDGTLVVGARYESTEEGNEGAAYIFKKSDGNWSRIQIVQPDDIKADDLFGRRVAIDGDHMIVGAGSDPMDGALNGAAYFFSCCDGTWKQTGKFESSDIDVGDIVDVNFSISGDHAVFLVDYEDANGDYGSAAYVFAETEGTWVRTDQLQMEDEYFGTHIALSGETAVIGALDEESKLRAAYLYQRKDGKWTQSKTLVAGEQEAGDGFGALAISGDTVVMSAGSENSKGKLSGAVLFFAPQRSTAFEIGGAPVPDAGPVRVADVQIWNKARTPQEINDSMYLRLTGQESGLSGYWRMGGIVPGESGKVVDFSVHRNDATVSGDAFVSARSLNRHLAAKDKDGQPIVATEFINDEFFAVSQRAKYLESFEFRIDDGAEPNVDQFVFSYWGKTSRGSDERIPENPSEAPEVFAVQQAAFQPVHDATDATKGWYRASCSFVVPDGITLVRLFGVSKVTGDWQELYLRKHSITHISDCITEEHFTDKVNLDILTDDQEAHDALRELDGKEKAEGALLKEKRHLEMILSRDGSASAELIRAKNRDIEETVNSLTYHTRQKEFFTVEDQRAAISAKYTWTHSRDMGAWTDYDHTHWDLKIGSYSPPNRRDWYPDGKLIPEGLKDTYQDGCSTFTVMTEGMNTDAAYIKKMLAFHSAEVSQLNSKLVMLRADLARLTGQSKTNHDKLKASLNKVTTELNQLAEMLAPLSDKILSSIGRIRQRTHTMTGLATDARGLKTKGAILGFLRPASRLSAIETSEGNVQLSYFDAAGRISRTNFDATADSLNSHFEEWIPDRLRSCIDFHEAGGPLELTEEQRIRLPKAWTIEAWVSFPMTDLNEHGGAGQPNSWRCLAGSKDGKDAYLATSYTPIDDREFLGLRVNDQFQSSGYLVNQIPDGWHHLAAVSEDGASLFYLDGKQIASYPTAEKLENARKVREDADPESQTLADARLRLEKATLLNDKEAMKSAGQTVSELEKKPLIKTGAGKIAKARDEAMEQQPEGAIATLCGGKGAKPFGRVAELRIWNLALPPEEIEVNSKTLPSGNEPGLVAWYPMDEASGEIVRDQTGHGRDCQFDGTGWRGCSAPIGIIDHATSEVTKFDGNESVVVANVNGIQPDSHFTLEAWLMPENPVNDIGVIFDTPGFLVYYRLKENNFELTIPGLTSPVLIEKGPWRHLAFTVGNRREIRVYIDGEEIESGRVNSPVTIGEFGIGCFAGSLNGGNQTDGYHGLMTEVRIWDIARSAEEIQKNRDRRVRGSEENLAACWSLTRVPATSDAMTNTGLDHRMTDLTGKSIATFRDLSTVDGGPFAPPELVTAEYSTMNSDPGSGRKFSMMRRSLAYPSSDGIAVLSDKRVEELELVWIGNSQFAPTLLGYIEGAPPIPSENLTEENDYKGATSVTLETSEDVAFSWVRTDDAGVGTNIELFAGTSGETSAGLGVEEQVEKHKAGFKGKLELKYEMVNESNVSSESSIKMTDTLSLRGTQEQEAKFPHLGKRFIPKNVGYALVISALADVFISRLQRSKRMIGYKTVPVADIPPDINTITFLINPAYTMAGSLDGLTGSSATSQRFYQHVPEMRAQYGSQYPASFYRLQEAYDLKKQIDAQDKARESYFENFNSRLVDTASLGRETGKGAAPTVVGVHPMARNDTDDAAKQKAAGDRQAEVEKAGQANLEHQSEEVGKKRGEIEAKISDRDKRTHAQAGLQSWQRSMEDIRIRAGKRNIVNNYVWDADGGMRCENQSFANVAEHTIGGNFHYEFAGGGEAEFEVAGADVELTAQGVGSLTQTMAKTQNHSTGFSLEVDLGGVESSGITDHDDYPLMPGEKVDRYRFMSFYLEGSTKNFNDFFDYVVDPEWLASNDEEARALRQANGKANKTWRVLHRVTYVERPALMGFGRDHREPGGADSKPSESEQIAALRDKNVDLETKLDQILALLKNQQTGSANHSREDE